MIVKFNNFLNEKNLVDFEITYDQSKELLNCIKLISDYLWNKDSKFIELNLPLLAFYSSKKDISKTNIIKLLKYAKKNNDEKLKDLIDRYLKKIEEFRLINDTKKYNL